MKKKNFKWDNFITFLIAALVCIFTLGPFFYYTDSSFMESSQVIMDEGWDIQVNDSYYEDVVLSKTVFPVTNQGDVVTLTHTLKEYANIENPVLRFYSVHSVSDVYYNDELIYSYGKERYAKGYMVGYGYHFVELPRDNAEAVIKIVFTVTENDAFTGIPYVSINNGKDFLQQNVSEDRFRLAGAMLLIVFGTLAMVISTIMILVNKKFFEFFCIGTFSGLIGVWTLCNNDMILYFTQDLLVKCYLEYISIYALPLPYLFYFFDRINEERKKRGNNAGTITGRSVVQSLYWFLLISQCAFFAIILFCQFTNIAHFPAFLHLSHILMVLDILFIAVIFVAARRSGKKVSKGVKNGLFIIIAFLIFELIRYNVDKYIFMFTGNKYNSTLCFAALAIVIAFLADFSARAQENLYEQAQQNLLEDMAYSDQLTGLGNRRKCDDVLIEFDKAKKDYAIYSIDLNLLKYYNDTYGHQKGDELIRAYGEILTKCFDDDTTICRNGGDEFAILISDVTKFQKDIFERRYEQAVAAANIRFANLAREEGLQGDAVRISAAMGYAMKRELDSSASCHEVFRLADDRMYEEKRKMKEARN